MENKTIRCPKCASDMINESRSLNYDFSYYTCQMCGEKSENKEYFIGVKA